MAAAYEKGQQFFKRAAEPWNRTLASQRRPLPLIPPPHVFSQWSEAFRISAGDRLRQLFLSAFQDPASSHAG